MRKLFALSLLALAFSAIADESRYLRTYDNSPCSFWSIDGRCNSHFSMFRTPEAYSLMSIIDRLESRIENLETKVTTLNQELEDIRANK